MLKIFYWILNNQYLPVRIEEWLDGKFVRQYVPPWPTDQLTEPWDASFMVPYVGTEVEFYVQGKLQKKVILKSVDKNEKGFWRFELDD